MAPSVFRSLRCSSPFFSSSASTLYKDASRILHLVNSEGAPSEWAGLAFVPAVVGVVCWGVLRGGEVEVSDSARLILLSSVDIFYFNLLNNSVSAAFSLASTWIFFSFVGCEIVFCIPLLPFLVADCVGTLLTDRFDAILVSIWFFLLNRSIFSF